MRVPSTEPPALPQEGTSGRHTWTFELRTVTPIYKGGPRAEVDTKRPFRASAIKGLLRFWWRATSEIVDVADLREAEGRLFGTVFDGGPIASRVHVHVSNGRSRAVSKPPGLDYALWVMRGNTAKAFHDDASGRVTVSVDAPNREPVRRALRAWLLLGGIGGRTRRGLGSVHTDDKDLRPNVRDVEDFVAAVHALAPETRLQWPSLGAAQVLVGPKGADAMAACRAAVQTMQAVRMDTSHNQDRPIRLGFVPHCWHDDDYIHLMANRPFRSPRAALGLPLQFQSWGGGGQRRSLKPLTATRFPSPVHLRPVHIGGVWRPVMVILTGPSPERLTLGGSLDKAGTDLFATEVARVPGWSRTMLGGRP